MSSESERARQSDMRAAPWPAISAVGAIHVPSRGPLHHAPRPALVDPGPGPLRRHRATGADDINTMSFTTLLSAQIAEW